MDIGFEYNQSLQQTHKISQKLIQAVQILQMNTEELNSYIEEQFIKNPVLEIERNDLIDWEKYAKGTDNIHNFNNEKYEDEDKDRNLAVYKTTFIEDLLIQWHVKKHDKTEEKIGEWVIQQINDRGYMDIAVEDIARRLKVSANQIEKILTQVQSLEPAGIACMDLSERLIIQLERKGIKDNLLIKLVKEHMPLLEKKKWKEICKKLDISRQQLKDYMEYIQTLNPVLNVCYSEQTIYIQPQVSVVELIDGYDVEYNETKEINLYISSQYKQLMNNPNIDEDTKTYIKRNLDQALWLIRNIEERKQNILNISKCIINRQQDFLKYGKAYMKSLTQKEVADELDISISTVSRIVNGKYIDTPQGIHELKYFFSSGIEKNNEGVSSIAVKNKLKEIIENEDRTHPLSDEKIKIVLNNAGVEISRRTVAKYRMSLGILNASGRKEL